MSSDEAYTKIVSVLEQVGFVSDELKDQISEIVSVVGENSSDKPVEKYTGPGNYEFTFVVVTDSSEGMEDALSQARSLVFMDSFEPVSVDCLEKYEE